MAISADVTSLNNLFKEIEQAALDYEQEFKKTDAYIQQLIGADFKGDTANAISSKFEEKKPKLASIETTMKEAAEYARKQKDAFVRTVEDTNSIIK